MMEVKLTLQEEEALRAVFQTGEGSIKMIMENMVEKLPYTTVASTIKNLEKKGYIQGTLMGNTYFYKPALSQQAFKAKFMNHVVKHYFDNSYRDLVSFFVKQKKLTPKELEEIISLIEKDK